MVDDELTAANLAVVESGFDDRIGFTGFSTMSPTVAAQLDRILSAYAASGVAGALPRQPFDPEWISPCQIGTPDDDGMIAWRPAHRRAPADWSGLENALEASLHPDVAAFYGTFWSDSFQFAPRRDGPR